MKFLLKRYMEYEVQNGSEKDVERVKAKAQKMVEAMSKGEVEEEDEEMEADE